MRIYLDESFDLRGRYMCLGVLFLPDDGPTNGQMEAIKEKYRRLVPGRSFSDVKYTKSGENFTYEVCREIVDLFISQPAWFRALVIDTTLSGFSWGDFGGRDVPRALAKARAYGRLTELLLERNLQGVEDAVLLADSLTEPVGDDFIQRIIQRFGSISDSPGNESLPYIRYAQRVDTSLPDYQLGQMCDVLLGIVTGDLVPPTNSNKLTLIQHVKDALHVPNFGPDYWLDIPEDRPGEPPSKFHVWHWRPK